MGESFKVFVTKDYLKFSAAHFIAYKGFRENLHGHNYRVRVHLRADRLDELGMVLDFADLKGEVRSVLSRYDHRHWNDFLDYPTVENICQRLADELAARLAVPFTIRVYEGHAKWAETRGEPPAGAGQP